MQCQRNGFWNYFVYIYFTNIRWPFNRYIHILNRKRKWQIRMFSNYFWIHNIVSILRSCVYTCIILLFKILLYCHLSYCFLFSWVLNSMWLNLWMIDLDSCKAFYMHHADEVGWRMESDPVQPFRFHTACVWYQLCWDSSCASPCKLSHPPHLLFWSSLFRGWNPPRVQIISTHSGNDKRSVHELLYYY